MVAVNTAGVAHADVTGPDVASYQHPGGAAIDWNGVASAGMSFAFVKATEGRTYTNPYFSLDWAAVAAAGAMRGAYHFARPSADLMSAVTQAQHFVAVVGSSSDPGTLPPVLDLEVTGGLSPPDLALWAQNYLSTVATLTGRTPIIYTYPSFWASAMANDVTFAGYPLWIARYGNQPPGQIGGWPSWTFWQYTDTAALPGIGAPVDASTFNGGYNQLRAMAGLGPGTAPSSTVLAPVSAPAPIIHPPVGGWTSLHVAPGGVQLRAWAADPDAATAASPVQVSVDGQPHVTPVTSSDRPDIAAQHPELGPSHGLDLHVRLTPGSHQICLTAEGTASVKSTPLGCRTAVVTGDPQTHASLTRTGDRITATGWALDPQTGAPITVRVLVNGRLVRHFLAQSAQPAPTPPFVAWGAHGYLTTYPVHGKAKVCIQLVNWSAGRNVQSCRQL